VRRRRRLITLIGVAAVGALTLVGVWPQAAGAGPAPPPTGPVNAELPWHPVTVDPGGGLLAWYRPRQHRGYDEVLHLGWNFVEHDVPDQTGTGRKTYLTNSVFDGSTLQGVYWQSNPAMTFGAFVDSALAWYPYSGDAGAVRSVGAMLRYALRNGTTPANWSWANVPFPTGCGNQPTYGRCLSDMPEDYYGGIEPDKVGELGIGYARFYEMTGDRTYLRAAIHCADALARHVRPGDDSHTPWAFRVDGRTGATLDGETFGGAVVSPLRLFDELIRLRQGDVRAYGRARTMAWRWLDSHQLDPASPVYDDWSGYFEDVPKSPDNVNQAVPTYTALYLLDLPDPARLDPHWKSDVHHLITWVDRQLGVGPFYGATGINEQGPSTGGSYLCCSSAGLGSDTARWAAVNALYAARTRDTRAAEAAYRSLNYATYFAGSDGRVSCCGQSFGSIQYWFSDGYADYLRSFNWAMAALPGLAPDDQSHLLGSTSVVRLVTYGHDRIRYRTFDTGATDVLRLDFRPGSVVAGGRPLVRNRTIAGEGYTLQSLGRGSYVLRVHHVHSGSITVSV
jgi:hypothetical protein